MSINDQVAGWEPVAFLRCEKIQSTEFLNKPDIFGEIAAVSRKFSRVSRVFLCFFLEFF